MKRLRMFFACGNIAGIGGMLVSFMIEGKLDPFSIVLTAFSLAFTLTFYKEEVKELIRKFKGDDDNNRFT